METATIITTAANRELARLHGRMPVIVPPDAFDLWLDCSKVDATTAAALFVPAPEGVLEAHEISTAVNRTENDGPGLIEPLVDAPAAQESDARARVKRGKKPKTDERQSSLF
jgi:putative SOS response-associated peptidase YedK